MLPRARPSRSRRGELPCCTNRRPRAPPEELAASLGSDLCPGVLPGSCAPARPPRHGRPVPASVGDAQFVTPGRPATDSPLEYPNDVDDPPRFLQADEGHHRPVSPNFETSSSSSRAAADLAAGRTSAGMGGRRACARGSASAALEAESDSSPSRGLPRPVLSSILPSALPQGLS